MKIGQKRMGEIVLDKLPLPTVEEVGEDVVFEREVIKDRAKEKTVDEEIEHNYKEEELLLIQRKRPKLSKDDKIGFNPDDFKYKDAGKEVADEFVQGFLTTGSFDAEKAKEGEMDAGVLQTFQRLEKFKRGAGKDSEGIESLLENKDRVKDRVKYRTKD